MKIEISKSFIDLISSSKGHSLSDQKTKARLLTDIYQILFMIPGYQNSRRHNFPNGYEIYEGPGSSRIIAYIDGNRRVIVSADKHDTLYDQASLIVANPPEAYLSAELLELVEEGFHPKHDDRFLNALLSLGFQAPFINLLDRLDEKTREQILWKEKVEGSIEANSQIEKAKKEANRLFNRSLARASSLAKKEEALERARKQLLEQEALKEATEVTPLLNEEEEVITTVKEELVNVTPEPVTPVAPEVIEAEVKVEPTKPKEQTFRRYIYKEHDIVVDPASLERAILKSLEENYKEQMARIAKIVRKPLNHVRLAPNEYVITYTYMEELFKKIDGRLKRSGLRSSQDDWLLCLATSVPEGLIDILEEHYPGHVVYTDEPNKGNLKTAIIIKKAKPGEQEEDLSVKKVKSKQKDFFAKVEDFPFEAEDEDIIDLVRLYEDDDLEAKEADDFFSNFEVEEEPITEALIEPVAPKHWHCYVCGKKKLYHGPIPKTKKLSNGKTVYLCSKHKNAL